MTPEMEKLLIEAVIVLLRHSAPQLTAIQPYGFPENKSISPEWTLAERIGAQFQKEAAK